MKADPRPVVRNPARPAAGRAPGPDVGGREASRKAVHVSASMAAAGVAWDLPQTLVRIVFLAAVALALLVEVIRHFHPRGGHLFHWAFGTMLRHRESRGITGATSLAIGCALAVWLVPYPYHAAGIMIGGLGDAAAAVVGRRFGRHRFRSGKSLEGSLAAFSIALAIAWAVPTVGIVAALCAAVVLTVIELLPLPLDDNVILPLTTAATIWLVGSWPG